MSEEQFGGDGAAAAATAAVGGSAGEQEGAMVAAAQGAVAAAGSGAGTGGGTAAGGTEGGSAESEGAKIDASKNEEDEGHSNSSPRHSEAVRAQTGGDATGSRGEAAGAQSGLDTPSSCCFFILAISVPALPAPRGFM